MNNFFCYVPAFKQGLVCLSFLYLCSGQTEEAESGCINQTQVCQQMLRLFLFFGFGSLCHTSLCVFVKICGVCVCVHVWTLTSIEY